MVRAGGGGHKARVEWAGPLLTEGVALGEQHAVGGGIEGAPPPVSQPRGLSQLIAAARSGAVVIWHYGHAAVGDAVLWHVDRREPLVARCCRADRVGDPDDLVRVGAALVARATGTASIAHPEDGKRGELWHPVLARLKHLIAVSNA